MRVLVLGGGGREHAIGWRLKKDFPQGEFFFTPGNGGTERIGVNIVSNPENAYEIASICAELKIDFIFVGPENPLAGGVVDILEKEGRICFGPNQKASKLEASKAFAKKVMERAKIPTADFKIYTKEDFAEGKISPEKLKTPIVIKASGLCAGKGVFVCKEKKDIQNAFERIFVKREFGDEGNEIVIEDFLEGREISYFALCSRNEFASLGFARDYKRLLDGDAGPNTGGMGSYTPVEYADEKLKKDIETKIVKPLMNELEKEGIKYTGILYVGLMIDDKGNPYVLEFNVRLGDPETQVLMPCIDGNFFDAAINAAEGKLVNIPIKNSALCVVISAKGYPEKYQKGMQIKIEGEEEGENFVIFHAGTRRENGKLISSGGRILGVVGLGKNKDEARKSAYEKIKDINIPDSHYRRDIGL